MDNISQYQFELLEVAKLLLKKQGVKEGLWTVGVQFSIGVANVGPDLSKFFPSVLVGVDKFVISRATEPSPLTVDASTIS